MNEEGLRAALRRATRDAHDRVDAAFGRMNLSDPVSYRRFLEAHVWAVLPLEAALDAAGADRLLPDWPARRRGGALLRDLAALQATAPTPPCTVFFGGAPEVWGGLYVLEGSRLGARVLAREAAGPRAYLLHGERARLWPSFVQLLEASGADPERAASGARAAFNRFEEAARLL